MSLSGVKKPRKSSGFYKIWTTIFATLGRSAQLSYQAGELRVRVMPLMMGKWSEYIKWSLREHDELRMKHFMSKRSS